MSCICGAPAVQFHHVVYRQHVKKHGGEEDLRNVIALCYDCHRRHHSRHEVIPQSSLPPAAKEYAHELLGDAAGDYLNRYYGGTS